MSVQIKTPFEVLSEIPVTDLVSHLKSLDYYIYEPGILNSNSDLLSDLNDEGYELLSTFEEDPNLVDDGAAKVKFTGSMKDTETEEILSELNEKYGYNLPNKLRELL